MSDAVPIRPVTRLRAWPWVLAILAFVAGVLLTGSLRDLYQRRFAPRPVVATPVAARPATPVPAAPTPDFATLASREAVLAAQVAALEARTASVSGDAAAASGQADRAENLLIAFAARRAIDRGSPLGYLEPELRRRFADCGNAVAAVIAASHAPVTLEDLRQALDASIPELTSGGLGNAPGGGWSESLWRELSGLVVIRKAGTPSPRPTDRLARARRLIEAEQVSAALAEVQRLPGAAGATNWVDAARRYIRARRALDILEHAAIGAARPLPVVPPPSF